MRPLTAVFKCDHLPSASHPILNYPLDHQTLDLILQRTNLGGELRGLVGGDAAADHGSRDTTGAAQCHLRRHVDVGSVLVFAQKSYTMELVSTQSCNEALE